MVNILQNVEIRSMVPDVQKTVDIVSMENSVTMSMGLATMVVKLASINLDVKEVNPVYQQHCCILTSNLLICLCS